MDYNINTILEQTRQLNLTGNIIPHSWYSKIKFPSGTPDLLGIVILADIVYWYRPVEIKDEKTGRLISYKKKFKADMLQRGLGDFAKQFGYNKRQIADALKRLEDAGLIIKKHRAVETSMGVMNNVLYVAPVPSAIAALDQNTDQQDYSSVISTSDDNDFAMNDEPAVLISSDVPPTTIERSRGYDRTYEVVRPIVVGGTIKRSTYTENTTKITTENTAAAQKAVAAVVFSNKDALIADTLTDSQRKIIEGVTHELAQFVTIDSVKLAKEIEFVILSSTAFTNAHRDFFKKLNTIKKVIKERRWNTPAGMLVKNETEQKKAIDPIKRELHEAELDYVHWKKMVNLMLETGKEKGAEKYQLFLFQAKEKLDQVKLKFGNVLSHKKLSNTK